MAGKTINLTPETEFIIEKLGSRIKKARLRRNIMAEILAERVGISKGTLSAIEKGEPTVSIGAYIVVLNELDMVNDIERVAVDTEGKKLFWQQNVKQRERASKNRKGK